MEEWYKFEKIGSLWKEIDLVVGNEPILFICINRHGERFLTMTYDSLDMVYVISPITVKTLVDMLTNKITMEQAFRSGHSIYISSDSTNDVLFAKRYDSREFPSDKLPDRGEYFELDFEYIQNYIKSISDKTGEEYEIEVELYDAYEDTLVCHYKDTVDYFGKEFLNTINVYPDFNNSVLVDYNSRLINSRTYKDMDFKFEVA